MSDLGNFSDKEIQEESRRRHRIRERFRRATELVRESGAATQKMTLAQSLHACEYIAAAMGLSHEAFADAILKHANCAAYFQD